MEIYLFDISHQLSYINKNDRIRIISSLKYRYEERFRCHTNKYDSIDEKNYIHDQNCCFGKVATTEMPPSEDHIYDDLWWYTCPCNFLDNTIFALEELETQATKFGNYPKDVYMIKVEGLMGQPSKLIQCFNIIKGWKSVKEAEENKARADEQRSKMNK